MIGNRIRKLRIKKGLSLSELAKRANVSKSYLSSVERNIQSNPSIQFLEKVSHSLEIDIQLLIDESIVNTSLKIDEQWLLIIHEAIELGISIDQLKSFFEYSKWKIDHQDKM